MPREVPQYISDKYVRQLFADIKQDDRNLSRGKHATFPEILSNTEPSGPTVKDLLKELRSLGFKDTKVCLEAMRKKGNDLDKIIEYLINLEENEREKGESVEFRKSSTNNANSKEEFQPQNPSESFPNIHSYIVPPEDEYNPWTSLQDESRKDNLVSNNNDPFSKRKG
jgi:hypothetical protein